MNTFKKIALISLLSISGAVFADDTTGTNGTQQPAATTTTTTTTTTADTSKESSACKNIAKACKSAGFVKQGDSGKRIWMDCMKPIILEDQTVAGVTVSQDDIKTCRTDKIIKNQNELNQLQKLAQ